VGRSLRLGPDAREPSERPAGAAVRASRAFGPGHTLFFVLLLSLLTSMHDRYQPVYVARVVRERQGTST